MIDVGDSLGYANCSQMPKVEFEPSHLLLKPLGLDLFSCTWLLGADGIYIVCNLACPPEASRDKM